MENAILPMAGEGQSERPDVTTPTGELTNMPGVTGELPGALGFGVNVATGGRFSPGVNAVTGLAEGKSTKSTATDFAADVLGAFGKSLLNDVLGDLSPLANVGIAGIKESFKDDPNIGAAVTSAGIQTGATMIGGATLGLPGAIIGGLLSGYASRESFKDGLLGDMTDARSFESYRDDAEDQGYSRSDTEGMADREGMARESGYSGFGTSFDDANKGTSFGNLKDASTNAFGDPRSLGSYASTTDLSDLDDGEGDSSSDGAMGDTGGRSSGDPDGDAGSDPN